MTAALEIRLVCYALAALAIFGGIFYAGHHVASIGYEAQIAADHAAQDKALQSAKDHEIAVLQAQQDATNRAEKQYANLKATTDAAATRFADSVRQLTAQIHSGAVPQVPAAASGSNAATTGTSSDSGIAAGSGRAVQACLDDDARLTALQQWVASLGELIQ